MTKFPPSMTRLELIEQELATLGCGDHGCVTSKPSGQGTNGGCRCIDTLQLTPERRTKLRRVLMLRQEQVKLLWQMVWEFTGHGGSNHL